MNINLSFEEHINNHTSTLLKRAKYVIENQEEAEDMVQEVFLIAFQKFDKFKHHSSVKTWLLSILNHKIADYYRKKYKGESEISFKQFFDKNGTWKENQITSDWNDESSSLLTDEDFTKVFNNCIEKLPNKWKIPIKLYYLEEVNSKQLSQELGLSTTNIWKILQRGRLHLKNCIENNWFES